MLAGSLTLSYRPTPMAYASLEVKRLWLCSKIKRTILIYLEWRSPLTILEFIAPISTFVFPKAHSYLDSVTPKIYQVLSEVYLIT